jgi:hypothetical protein
MGHHRYWLAQILDKPRWTQENGTIEIYCNPEFIKKLEEVRDKAEKRIEKACKL